MKLFDNISGLSIIGGGMAKLGPNKKAIEKARAEGDIKTEQEEILKACQIWSNHIVERMQVDIRVIHEENLPKHGPVVFIANHQSYADILTFLYIVKNHQVAFIAKDNLEKIPFFGKWVERIRGIYIHRGDARASLATINEGVEYLKQGFSLVIFPEGTREKDGKLLPPKSGLFVIAAGAGVDVVPCRILYDTPDGKMHLFCKVRVIYGEPMPAEQFAMESRRDTKKLRANKQALLDAWEKMGA